MNFFFINGTPLQLLIAEEIKKENDIKDENSILAIRKTDNDPRKYNIKSISEVRTYGQWKNISIIPQKEVKSFLSYLNNFLRYVRATECLLETNGQIENIFLGNYGNEAMRHIANKYSQRGVNVVFLDEGIGTIQLYNQREIFFRNRGKTMVRWSSILKYLLGLSTHHIKNKITFFTIYDLVETEHTKIIKNRNVVLKNSIQKYESQPEIFLLGSPFSERGYCSVEQYLDWLAFIKQYFSEHTIIYFAHPRENLIFLKLYQEKLSFEMRFNEMPFELYVLQEKILPNTIVAFVSTALINSYDLFGDLCRHVCFVIPIDQLYSKREAMLNLYAHLRQSYINSKIKFIDINFKINN